MLDPLVNCGLEFSDVVEGSSPDALASDFGEEPLDEVEPGTGCRREVQCEAFVSRPPALDGRRLGGGVVVEDQMQIEMCGRLAVDCFQKRQELVCPMACQTFADDGTGRHIERGEECCCAVALVIMGHRAGTALFQGQTRLRAVECLDLALLIDGKHQRLLRRIDVKADDVLDLRDEVGIVGILKLRTRCGLRPCSAQMRCTLVWLMPISSAIDRTLQCVALAGRSFTVFSTTLSFMAALSGFRPGGLERPLIRPSTPASAK